MRISVRKTATGRHYFKGADGRILWVSDPSTKEMEAIASISRRYPGASVRFDYDEKQPRDKDGKFAKTNSLNQKSVRELQDHASSLGIDISTLSHKGRRSVLTSAIETHTAGGDLGKAGLLKPLGKGKAKPKEAKATPPASAQGKQPVRLTGDNAIAVTDKKEFRQLFKQWDKVTGEQEAFSNYLEKRKTLSDFTDLMRRREGEPAFVLGEGTPLPDKIVKDNRKYLEQKNAFTEEVRGDEKAFGTVYSRDALATVSGGKDGNLARVSMPGVVLIPSFKTRQEAEDYARNHVRAVASSRVIPSDKAEEYRKYLADEPELKKLEGQVKDLGIKDLSEENLKRASDNRWIAESVLFGADDRSTKVIAVKDKENNLQAAMTYTVSNPRSKTNSSISVDYLATSPWNAVRSEDPRTVVGAGARAIAEAAKLSQSKGYDGRVSLFALPGAVGFYEKLGFVKMPDGQHFLSGDKARDLIAKYG